ncbi:MAG: hypothetical protein IJR49_01410, partial [Treponema sp.]|nr:hypothetical protein [Treponema sp.]
VATYNLSRYFIHMNMPSSAIPALEKSITLFKNTPRRKLRDAYKEIDAHRLLGEEFVKQKEFLRVQEAYTEGIMLFEQEKLSSNFQGNESIGKLYADAGDIDYFIRGDLDSALAEYNSAIKTFYDTPSLRYRIGYIHYGKQRYTDAISSFIKANEEKPNDVELLLSLANSLTFRDDIIAASSYYERLVENLDNERTRLGVLLPQVRPEQAELVELYLRATNNLGVVQHRLARRTGNSELNAQALVNLSTSLRAWDALTRNQDTMIRLSGSNLAEQNIRYITHPMAEYEPAIYTEISKTLSGEKELQQ